MLLIVMVVWVRICDFCWLDDGVHAYKKQGGLLTCRDNSPTANHSFQRTKLRKIDHHLADQPTIHNKQWHQSRQVAIRRRITERSKRNKEAVGGKIKTHKPSIDTIGLNSLIKKSIIIHTN